MALGNTTIQAPRRTNLVNSLGQLKQSGALPEYKPVSYTPVQATNVSGITDTLGDDYFNRLEQQATQKLQNQFFNDPNSVARNLQNTMNKRGLIGSGIEVGGLNQMNKTFGDELVNLQSNLAQQRAEVAKDLAYKNKEIEMQNAKTANEIAMQNAQQQLAAQQKDREFQGFLSELGLRSAADEAKTATDFDTKMFEQQVLQQTERDKLRADLMNQIQSAMGTEIIDPDTRNFFESIFGTQMGDIFGRPTMNPTTGENITYSGGTGGGSSFSDISANESSQSAIAALDSKYSPAQKKALKGQALVGSDGLRYRWNGYSWERA